MVPPGTASDAHGARASGIVTANSDWICITRISDLPLSVYLTGDKSGIGGFQSRGFRKESGVGVATRTDNGASAMRTLNN